MQGQVRRCHNHATRQYWCHHVGNFIYHNYRQAIDVICDDGAKLDVLSEKLNTGPDDYERYLVSEQEYLERLRTEPREVLQTVSYMEVLGRLEKAA
jgi:hypothetical protein